MAVVDEHLPSIHEILPEDGVNAELDKMAEEAGQEPAFIGEIAGSHPMDKIAAEVETASEPEVLGDGAENIQEARHEVAQAIAEAVPATPPEEAVHRPVASNPDSLDTTSVTGA